MIDFADIAVLVCSGVGAIALVTPLRLRWIAIIALLAGLAYVTATGVRWQIAPLGAATGFAVLALFTGRWQHGRLATRLLAGMGIGLLAIGVVAIFLFPVFSFPPPRGLYGVGTRVEQWVDPSRPDIFSTDGAAKRTLVAQVYYPVDHNARGPHAPYLANAAQVSHQIMGVLGLPPFLISHLNRVVTNAVENAPPIAGAFPALIFLSGADGYANSNYAQVQALVARGYIVVCLDQPGTAASVHLDNGSDINALPRPELDRLIAQGLAPVTPAPVLNRHSLPDGIIGYLAEDAVFAEHQLSRLDAHGPLVNHIDLSHIGVFGISLGGMAVPEACAADSAFKACLIMDSQLPAAALDLQLKQPTLFITRPAPDMAAEGWSKAVIARHLNSMRRVYDGLLNGGGFAEIPGAFHANFGDTAFLSPVTGILGITGPIDGRHCEAIIEALQGAFFDKALKGEGTGLAPITARFPDVRLQLRE